MGAELGRRGFLAGSLSLAAAGCGARPPRPFRGPAAIATWDFGRKANEAAWRILAAGGAALDAVEQGINEVELDPEITSVGWGGLPNEDGETTLDAMIMCGARHAAGAVACLKRIRRAISVARRVMERTKHTMLVGEDATRFALAMGFREEELLTPKAKAAWQQWKASGRPKDFWSHDTVGLVAVDAGGEVATGCSTSGLAFKIAGRVGDSPLVGSGAYCDGAVGGSAATGNGDVMMRFCPTLVAVELMRAGRSPEEACAESLRRIELKGYKTDACLVALRKDGTFGAAKIGARPFSYAVRRGDCDEIRILR